MSHAVLPALAVVVLALASRVHRVRAWFPVALAAVGWLAFVLPAAAFERLGDGMGDAALGFFPFFAILLDVDNGPSAVAHAANDRLYGERGVRACSEALRQGGVLAVWSAGPDDRYRTRLEKAGLDVEVQSIPAREGTSRGARHVVFVAVKDGDRPRRT